MLFEIKQIKQIWTKNFQLMALQLLIFQTNMDSYIWYMIEQILLNKNLEKKKKYYIYSKTKNKTEVPINKTNANKNIPTCSEPIQRPQK